MLVIAWPTSTETPKPQHAPLVQMVVRSMLSHQQLPLPPLIARAQSAPTETAAHAQLVTFMLRTVVELVLLVSLLVLAMLVTLAAPRPPAQHAKRARSRNQLATM